MNYLIDTHVLIWFTEGDAQLPLNIRSLIADPKNTVFVSHACIWEIAIKTSIGKLNVTLSLPELEASHEKNGFVELPTCFHHFGALINLPQHHQDPFDRLIIAQAISENYTVISHDPKFKLYTVKLLSF